MHTYIGTKMIMGTPMTRGKYNEYRGWTMPENEDGNEEGYLVEYPDGNTNHENHAGYISWSPKNTFEASYIDLGHIADRLPYQQRVIGERAELKKKLEALADFLNSPASSHPSSIDLRPLHLQRKAMVAYLSILDMRINEFY